MVWCPPPPSHEAQPLFVKIDLQNAYCSMVLPRWWRRLLVVRAMVVHRLPFGWSCSVGIFLELAHRLVGACRAMGYGPRFT